LENWGGSTKNVRRVVKLARVWALGFIHEGLSAHRQSVLGDPFLDGPQVAHPFLDEWHFIRASLSNMGAIYRHNISVQGNIAIN
jgi:hypothetical protein